MLMDILATITAFITVMLLFSLLVTASVQAINSMFQLRFHNLRVGLDVFAEDLMNDDAIDAEAKDKIKTAVASCIPIKSEKAKLKMPVRPEAVAVENVQSSVKQQVGGLLSQQNLEKLDDVVVHHFKNVEFYMAQRFQKISHLLSISIGLIIAIIYQINTPDLLNRLSVDPALREAYISQAQELMSSDAELKPSFSYPAAAEQAIHQLISEHPNATGLTALLDSDLSSETAVMTGIKNAFANDESQYQTLRLDYQKTVGAVLQEAETKYRQQWQAQMDQVALLNFKIMPNGWRYYTDTSNWSVFFHNYIGVLISGVLISLGAPFWFKNLKTMFDLQERLRKRAGVK
ncbi:hypothetical protein CBF23_009585 [Marinomonas agarivorans]|nr:hypothetical protein CBF23_009585 [Marinomonas agarivorans]